MLDDNTTSGNFYVICRGVPCGKVDVGTSRFDTGGEIIRMALNEHQILGVGIVLNLQTIVPNLG